MKRSIGREKLATVLRSGGDLVTVQAAADSLGVSRQEAAKTLWSWSRQGWFTHVRRGVYAPIPPDSLLLDRVLHEPWIVVPELFGPAYVGGWSAAERWDLTDQIFRSVLVYTTRTVRPREQTIQGTTFVLKRVKPDNIFGVRSVWFGAVKVQVSDRHRTVIDMLDDPRCGGGIRHVNDCLASYMASEEADASSLIEYAERLGNGAVFKRLGFLLSRMGADDRVIEGCRSRITTGNSKLDPALPCRRLIRRWNLWIPKSWETLHRD